MKLQTLLLLAVQLAAFKGCDAGKYEDGRKAGKSETRKIWTKSYDSDCDSVFEFSVEIKDDLIDGDYRTSRNDNWANQAFKRGQRDGAKAELTSIQKECLDPGYCTELGITAAELIVADFCGTTSYLGTKNRGPVEMCRDASTATCEGNIYSQIKETLADTMSCGPISNNIKKLTTAMLLDLQDECKGQVDEMILWSDLKHM